MASNRPFAQPDGTGAQHPHQRQHPHRPGCAPVETIRQAMSTLFLDQPGLVGLTAVGVNGGPRQHVEQGLFGSDAASLGRLAARAAALGARAQAVYVGLNPIAPSCTGFPKNEHIVERRWLLIDADPVRPADASATDLEKMAARHAVQQLRTWLSEEFGFPRPILADSGNGFHLLYRVAMRNCEQASQVVRAFLKAISDQWSNAAVSFDPCVHDARRVTKLYGTPARKGADSPLRPHRASALLEVPPVLAPVPETRLELVARSVRPVDARAILTLPSAHGSAQAGRRGRGQIRAYAADRRACYARAALEREASAVASTPPGQRNHRLFRAAASLFELVNAGALDPAETSEALANAARQAGLDPAEIDSVLRSARKTTQGKDRPLVHLADSGQAEAPGPATRQPAARSARSGAGKAAPERIASQATADQPREFLDDPFRLARDFQAARFRHASGSTLSYWNDEWWCWSAQRGHWRVLPTTELVSSVTLWMKRAYDRLALDQGAVSRPLAVQNVSNVVHMLRSIVTLPSADVVEQPTWLDPRKGDPPAAHCLATHNAVIDLPALVAGFEQGGENAAAAAAAAARAIQPATPRFFSAHALAYGFDPAPPAPESWLSFLETIWGHDPESIDALQEWFGYLLTSDTSLQRILLILGPRRSGKGTIARTLRLLLGENNVAAPTLSSLAGPFGLQPLLGKTLCLCPESRISGRADTQAIVERLLSISGEDPQTVDRKHLTPWHGILRTRFVMLGNEFPRLSDYSDAILGRLIVLRLTESWQGREDLDLGARFGAELPGILLWAIAGWQRLRARRRFVQPESGSEDLREAAALINPISAFLADRCVVGGEHKVAVADLYAAWKAWCQRNGRDHPGDVAGFGRNLKAQPGLKIREFRPEIDGLRVRQYIGILLKPEEESF